MIHSLSGGVIKDGGLHTFVKVRIDGEPNARWYLSDDMPVLVGMRVVVPSGGKNVEGVAERVDRGLTVQATPVPFGKAERVISVVFDEDGEE